MISKILIGLTLLLCQIIFAQAEINNAIESSFKNPPATAKPKTWLHAMSGNMSKLGMTKDLEAIAAAGQGGVLLFNIANGIPYGNVPYNSDKHHKIITHAAKECQRLNLTFGVHNCDGWTSSGGPWIKPEESMKMVVYSETIIEGGKRINIPLAQPSTLEGFYKDIAVVAYPALDTEIADAKFNPKITASDSEFDIDIIKQKGKTGSSKLNKNGENTPWILFDFGKIKEVRSFYLSYLGTLVKTKLEISSDGKNFTEVNNFDSFKRLGKLQWIISEQFDAIKARYFRISFARELEIINVKLSGTKPFNDFTKYTGFAEPKNYLDIKQNKDDNALIKKASIRNLSKFMQANGVLKTNLPKGKWTIMRFGYTSTGAKNWPASKWGIGLECDKFSRSAMKKHFDAFSQNVINNSKNIAPNALQYIEIDSYEMGGQNWTDNFDTIFNQIKGYNLIPFLPVFAGKYVESTEAVAGVTYDLNDVFTQLVTNNYYKYFTELCNNNGLKSYIEPYGGGPVSPLDVSAHIDLPMTEFWMNRTKQKRLTGTIHGAHIYGKNIISAEAFTSTPDLNWNNHPALAKTWGDMAWVAGVNEFMFHRFVHQANTKVKPGLTMGKWGANFDRTQTWWMNAGLAWFKYIARGSFLLRQGHPVADILVFVGDLPHKNGIKRNKLKYKVPVGLNYDCTNSHALINRFTIKGKKLVLPEGNAYSHLVLHDTRLITLATLRRIKAIVDAGIPVIGHKPSKLAGYLVTDNDKLEFDDLTKYIWSRPNCYKNFNFNSLQFDFKVKEKEVSFIHRKLDSTDIYFFYNKDKQPANYECVFNIANKIPELWNPKTGKTRKIANFKTEGSNTRVWVKLQALESTFITFRESANTVTPAVGNYPDIQFFFKPDNTLIAETFSNLGSSVVLQNGKSLTIPSIPLPKPVDLSTDWNVEFLKEHHFKANRNFSTLSDWKDSSEENIKYYSGTAMYKKTFTITKENKDDFLSILDLGKVDIVADVFVNGKSAGILWIAPFKLDITNFLKEGENLLEIKITNQWNNRLVGDENYPEQNGGYKTSSYIPDENSKMPDWYINNQPIPNGPRTTFSSWNFNKKGDALLPSGLKGPVKIEYKRIIKINTQ